MLLLGWSGRTRSDQAKDLVCGGAWLRSSLKLMLWGIVRDYNLSPFHPSLPFSDPTELSVLTGCVLPNNWEREDWVETNNVNSALVDFIVCSVSQPVLISLRRIKITT